MVARQADSVSTRRVCPRGGYALAELSLMLTIAELLLAPEITRDEVGYLGVLISEHHRDFVQLYPDESVLPKMHLA